MRYHVQDPPREKYESIEKRPEDYYPQLIYRPPEECNAPEEKVALARRITEDAWSVSDEKSESKSPKRKPKKVHLKPKRSAMAKVQKKL